MFYIEVNGFEHCARVEMTSPEDLGDSRNVTFISPKGHKLLFRFSEYINNCIEAISKPSSEWFFLFRGEEWWKSKFTFNDTDELQCVVALFHFSYLLLSEGLNFEALHGKGFFDKMKDANCILIPGFKLQEQIKQASVDFISKRLYTLHYYLPPEGEKNIYFRPYNLPIMTLVKNEDKILNEELKNEYTRIRTIL